VDLVASIDSALQIIHETFYDAQPRPAPLTLQSFSASGKSPDVLMFMTCTFVLMNVTRLHARTGSLLVPATLARQMFNARFAEVAWTNPADVQFSRQMLDSIQQDIFITVNTDHEFYFVYPDCADHSGYSATTVFLHEMMHGLGFFSLVDVAPGGEACLDSFSCAHLRHPLVYFSFISMFFCR
jgi:hypothetical protein